LNNQGAGGKGGCGAGPFKTLSLDEQRRIVGGTDAIRNSWPFVVSYSELLAKYDARFKILFA